RTATRDDPGAAHWPALRRPDPTGMGAVFRYDHPPSPAENQDSGPDPRLAKPASDAGRNATAGRERPDSRGLTTVAYHRQRQSPEQGMVRPHDRLRAASPELCDPYAAGKIALPALQ